MPAFRTNGSAGVAPNTIWFGALPDRLNFLTPNTGGISGDISPVGGVIVQADLANQWTLNACTLGATTTAPDGTTNAQAIVEDSSNGQHYISCTVGCVLAGGTGPLRIAGFFKPSGRRIVFKCIVGADTNNNAAIYSVFDLAGGQVGIAPTLVMTGSPNPSATFTTLGATISLQPDGSYLCAMDFSLIIVGANTFEVLVMLDNGTGTGALSNSYTGNGTSGTIGWRTNLMPVQSYAINNQTYFQDFNGTVASTIDVNNTQAPGFDLYVATNWPGFSPGQTPLSAGAFSIANSILTVTPNAGNSNGFSMSTNSLQPSTFAPVGRAFTMPSLWEIKSAYGLDVGRLGQHLVTMWSLSQEWESANGINSTNPTVYYGQELGFGEMDANGGSIFNGGLGFIQGPLATFPPATKEVSAGGFPNVSRGVSPYYAVQVFSSGINVLSGGVRYQAYNFADIGDGPPNASFWHVNNYSGGGGVPNYPITTGGFDYTQMHVYSALRLPYYGASHNAPGSPEQIGTQWIFVDGLMVAKAGAWAPGGGQVSPYPHIADWQSYGIFFSCDTVNGPPCHYDWVKVMQ